MVSKRRRKFYCFDFSRVGKKRSDTGLIVLSFWGEEFLKGKVESGKWISRHCERFSRHCERSKVIRSLRHSEGMKSLKHPAFCVTSEIFNKLGPSVVTLAQDDEITNPCSMRAGQDKCPKDKYSIFCPLSGGATYERRAEGGAVPVQREQVKTSARRAKGVSK